jgi:hypothetical protein
MRAESDSPVALPGLLDGIRPPNGCTLSLEEAGAYLRSLSLTPSSKSPFRGMALPEEVPGSDPEPDVAEAMRRLVRPELTVEVLGQEDAGEGAGRLFGMSTAETFVFHGRDEEGKHRIAWPIAREQIVAALERPLDLSSPIVERGALLTLDRTGLETLAAIVDTLQEDALVALLDRQPESPSWFHAERLREIYDQSREGTDFRWLVPRAMRASPVELSPSTEGFARGLEALAAAGHLVETEGLYSPRPGFGIVCSALAECANFIVVSTRRRLKQPDGRFLWAPDRFAFLRGTHSLWLLEFTRITHSGFQLRLGDMGPEHARTRLRAALAPTPSG